jgi:catechol 2,3-dioxygenase-like lactoylglutathione lyase family enzyme
MMTLTILLRCKDLDATRAFYSSVLGFSVADSAGDTLTVERNGGKLIFTRQDLWKSEPACSGTIYFTIPDTSEYYATVKDQVEIAWPLQRMPYGSSEEFGVKDCNGYHLAFQQDTQPRARQ